MHQSPRALPALGNQPQQTPEPSARTASGRAPHSAPAARIALAVLLVAKLMDILDQSVALTALPAIQESIGAGPAAVQWVTAGYSLTVAVGLITGGRLGDIHGRRKVLLVGTVVFVVASLLCGIATGPGVLIAARVLQGAGVALMIPQVLATLHVTLDGENRSRAFGLYGAVLSLANVMGPVLGGLLTQVDLFGLSWRPIFLINVPVGLAVVLVGTRFIPESTARTADRLDLTSMLLSAPAVVLIILPLTEGHAHHWPLWCFASLAAGLLVLGAFLRRQQLRKDDAPLVALSLFRGKQFLRRPVRAADARPAVRAVLHDLDSVPPARVGHEPAGGRRGLRAARSRRAGRCDGRDEDRRRFGRRLPQAGSLIALAAMGAYGLQVSGRQADLTILAMTVPVILIGFGLGMVGGPLADMSLAEVPHEQAGCASGLFNTAMHLGIAFGSALTALVFFSTTGGSADGVVNRDAFAASCGGPAAS
ncbi:MFS transporter [Streptomyces cirratus]